MKVHQWHELWNQLEPERRARIDEQVRQTLAEMPLDASRNARGPIQEIPAFPEGDVKIAGFANIGAL